jgi:hypothetical protein
MKLEHNVGFNLGDTGANGSMDFGGDNIKSSICWKLYNYFDEL